MKRLVPFCVLMLWLMFFVSARAWAAGAIVVGPGTLPDWHANSQVQLGWNFYDPTNPQDSSPLPKWCKAIGDIPVWDYEAERIVWEQPGQWYIRIPNLVNQNPVKHFWISWVYEFDPDTPGPRCFTNIDWFPDSGYGNYGLIEEWFDRGGNPTTNHFDAAYARITLNVDLYPNPNFEDIWLGTAGSMMVLEVYVKTLCVDACEGDFDHDDDVDGSDLAQLAADPGLLDLSLFAAEFGRTNCPHHLPS